MKLVETLPRVDELPPQQIQKQNGQPVIFFPQDSPLSSICHAPFLPLLSKGLPPPPPCHSLEQPPFTFSYKYTNSTPTTLLVFSFHNNAQNHHHPLRSRTRSRGLRCPCTGEHLPRHSPCQQALFIPIWYSLPG